MFRVIHPNRWFIWTVIIIITVSLGLMFYLSDTGYELDRYSVDLVEQSRENGYDQTYQGWRMLHAEDMGFSVKYPPSWQIEVDQNQERSFYLQDMSSYEQSISISVVDERTAKEIKDIIVAEETLNLVIDGHDAEWIKNSDKNDFLLKNVVFVKYDQGLVFLSGYADEFEKIAKSVKFFENE